MATKRCNATRAEGSLGQVVCVLIAILLSACSDADREPPQAIAATPPSKAAPATTAPDPAVVAARMQQCRAALEAAIPPGLLTNASFDNGRPILWVGPAWKTTTPAIRHALARNAACFFRSGDETQPIRFSVYDNATDREVAVWDHTHLLIL